MLNMIITNILLRLKKISRKFPFDIVGGPKDIERKWYTTSTRFFINPRW